MLLAATPLTLAGCAAIVDYEVATTAGVDTTVMAVGAAMYPSRKIIENAVNSAEHTTLVATVKAADLTGTLSGQDRSPYSRRPTRHSRSLRQEPSKGSSRQITR